MANNQHLSIQLTILREKAYDVADMDHLHSFLADVFDGCFEESTNEFGVTISISENLKWDAMSSEERLMTLNEFIDVADNLSDDEGSVNAELFNGGRAVNLDCAMTKEMLEVLFERCFHVSASLGSNGMRD